MSGPDVAGARRDGFATAFDEAWAGRRDVALTPYRISPETAEALALVLAFPDADAMNLAALGNIVMATTFATGPVHYSRSGGGYPTIRHSGAPWFTFRRIVPLIDWLETEDWIAEHRAKRLSIGRRSAALPMARLKHVVATLVQGAPAPFMARAVLIRDGDKRPIDHPETREMRAMAKRLNEQNEFLAAGKICDADGRDMSIVLQRIGVGDPRHGMRAYALAGAHQNRPKDERRQITIDGEKVAEPDHECLHPRLAYGVVGARLVDDAYLGIGCDRKLAKRVVNTALCAPNRRSMIGAVAHRPEMIRHVQGDEAAEIALASDDPLAAAELVDPAYREKAFAAAEALCDRVGERHAPISHLFGTGIGLRLQRTDSDMADRVTTTARRSGVRTLPVHDSHITPLSGVAIVRDAMAEAEEFGLREARKIAA